MVDVAKRASLLRKLAEEEQKEKQNAFLDFVKQKLIENNIPEDVLHDETSRDVLLSSLGKDFVFEPTQRVQQKLQALKDEAYGVLPQNIQTERWKPDTCGCELFAVYPVVNGEADLENRQTYHTVVCADHEGLNTEEIHHTIRNENTLKNVFEKALIESTDLAENVVLGGSQSLALKKDYEYAWKFEGKGKDRVFVPTIKEKSIDENGKEIFVEKPILKEQKNSIKSHKIFKDFVEEKKVKMIF